MRSNRCSIFEKLRDPELLIKKIESLGIRVKKDGIELIFVDIPEAYWINEEEHDPIFKFEIYNDDYEFDDAHEVLDCYMFDHKEVRDSDIFNELNDLLNFFDYKIVEIDHCDDTYYVNIVDGSLYAEEEVFKSIKEKNAPDFESCITKTETEFLTTDMIKDKFLDSISKILKNDDNLSGMISLINNSREEHITCNYDHKKKKYIYKSKCIASS